MGNARYSFLCIANHDLRMRPYSWLHHTRFEPLTCSVCVSPLDKQWIHGFIVFSG
ncbi:hypothetical protein B0H12DRAFT_1133969 [Mycena haematopus]|nr:hypothetical protein B0H12DRAFT_1133969 [Mycena haematopus]